MLRKSLITATLVSMLSMLALGPAFAAAPFKVSSTTPADGAVDVPLDSDVTIVWNRAVNCSTVTTANITISPPVGWALSTCDQNAGQAVFAPSGQAPATTYTVDVSTAVTDTVGEAMKNAYSMTYLTADVAAPPAGYTVVAKSGGDYADPVAAMIDLDSWCGAPSVDYPCLMKIRPGVFSIPEPLVMVSYVDIEGSGQGATVISSSIPSNGSFWNAGWVDGNGTLVVTGDNVSIRNLKIENRAPAGGNALQIRGADARIEHVTVEATAAGASNDFGSIIVYGTAGSAKLDSVTARTTEAGGSYRDYVGIAASSGASAEVSNSTGVAITTGVPTGGSWGSGMVAIDSGSSLLVRSSVIEAAGARNNGALASEQMGFVTAIASEISVYNCGTGECYSISGNQIQVAGSTVDGAIYSQSTVTNCWDASFAPILNQ